MLYEFLDQASTADRRTREKAVADGVVYFVSSSGSLAAIDASNGLPNWVYAIE